MHILRSRKRRSAQNFQYKKWDNGFPVDHYPIFCTVNFVFDVGKCRYGAPPNLMYVSARERSKEFCVEFEPRRSAHQRAGDFQGTMDKLCFFPYTQTPRTKIACAQSDRLSLDLSRSDTFPPNFLNLSSKSHQDPTSLSRHHNITITILC